MSARPALALSRTLASLSPPSIHYPSPLLHSMLVPPHLVCGVARGSRCTVASQVLATTSAGGCCVNDVAWHVGNGELPFGGMCVLLLRVLLVTLSPLAPLPCCGDRRRIVSCR
jgi:hypothetical protein